MSGKIEINGTDIHSTLGPGTRDARSWWDGISVELGTLSYQDSYQGQAGASFGVKAKTFPLGLFLRAPVRANRETRLDSLRRILQDEPDYLDSHRFSSDGEVGIKVEGSDRRLYCIYRGDRALPPPGLEWETGYAEVVLDLRVVDPGKYDDPETQAITTVAGEVDLGTLPSRWEMEIDGSVVDPAFIVQADNGGSPGAELFRITLDYSAGSGKTLTMDSLLHRILYFDGATTTDVTDSAFPVGTSERFEDLDAGANSSVWVKLSTGSGTLSWRKRWR